MSKNGIVQFITALFSLSFLALFRFVPQHLLSICLTTATMTEECSAHLCWCFCWRLLQLLYRRLVPLSTRNLTFFFSFPSFVTPQCPVLSLCLFVCLPAKLFLTKWRNYQPCVSGEKKDCTHARREEKEHEIEKTKCFNWRPLNRCSTDADAVSTVRSNVDTLLSRLCLACNCQCYRSALID